VAIKKSDLYSSLWASCDELRGGMDASQYKDYVLFMLFIKYVSDKYGDSTVAGLQSNSRAAISAAFFILACALQWRNRPADKWVPNKAGGSGTGKR